MDTTHSYDHINQVTIDEEQKWEERRESHLWACGDKGHRTSMTQPTYLTFNNKGGGKTKGKSP